MREIKFRVWDNEDKEYFKPIYEAYKGNLLDLSIGLGGDILRRTLEKPAEHQSMFPNKYILEQYTGLKDKNGVEIYEGDVVLFHGNYTSIEKCGRDKKGVVAWNLDGMRFDLLVEGLGSYDVLEETDEWHYKREVIGNIHQTKD